jgi:SAM-dependent methyltransferase
LSSGVEWITVPPAVSDREWLDFLLGEHPIAGLKAPLLPPPEVQSQFVGSNGRDALWEAAIFCSKLLNASEQFGKGLGKDIRLLDFGVGWGRLYRILLNRVLPQKLIGVDIDEKCIDLCRDLMPYGMFYKNEISPPLRFVDNFFDIIYAYSVFSHLAEHAFIVWVQEFHRLLKPGGLFVFTTLKDAHLEVWHRQYIGSDPWFTSYLKSADFDYREWQQKLDRGDFLYVPTGGGSLRDSSFYGEAIVTRQYLEKASHSLGYAMRVFDNGSELPQSFVVLQKVANESVAYIGP